MWGIGWIPGGRGKPVWLAKDLQMVIVKFLQLLPDPDCEDIKATQESWLLPQLRSPYLGSGNGKCQAQREVEGFGTSGPLGGWGFG